MSASIDARTRNSGISRRLYRLLTCFVAVLATILAGCSPSSDLERLPLSSVPSEKGMVGRSLMLLTGGPCVVFHPPPTLREKMELKGEVQCVSREWFSADGATAKLLAARDWSTFNCASFALCELLPVASNEWIEPGPLIHNYCTSPAQVVLDSFADMTLSVPVSSVEDLESDDSLRDDDIVCFVIGTEEPEIVHLGRIRREEGKNWIISKLGAGDLIYSSIQTLSEHYPSEFIRVYRAKDCAESYN